MDLIFQRSHITDKRCNILRFLSYLILDPLCLSTGGRSGRHTRRHRCHGDGGQRRELLRRAAERLRCDEEPGGALQRPSLRGPQRKR